MKAVADEELRAYELTPSDWTVYDAGMDREELDEALVELLEAGLIEVEYTESLEATFKATPKGKALVKDILKELK